MTLPSTPDGATTPIAKTSTSGKSVSIAPIQTPSPRNFIFNPNGREDTPYTRHHVGSPIQKSPNSATETPRSAKTPTKLTTTPVASSAPTPSITPAATTPTAAGHEGDVTTPKTARTPTAPKTPARRAEVVRPKSPFKTVLTGRVTRARARAARLTGATKTNE